MQKGPFFSIITESDDIGVGITAAPLLAWTLATAECRPLFVGVSPLPGFYAIGQMFCSQPSDRGTFIVYRGECAT